MIFRAILRDPFGTISGEGQIEMSESSVFGQGIAHVAGLEGRSMHVVSLPMTRKEHDGQIRQITELRYVQDQAVAWSVELTEA